MYTKTFDPLEISNARYTSKDRKTVPAMEFDYSGNTVTGKVLFLALNFSDPVVRLTFEALYLVGAQQIDETQFMKFVLEAVDLQQSQEELTSLLHRIRELRVPRDTLDFIVDMDLEILKSISVMLMERGNPSFCVGFKTPELREVSDFNEITVEYLTSLYGNTFIRLYDKITYNADSLGFLGRYFYPEDCFIGRENLHLESVNMQSGGSFSSFTAIRELYESDDFFNANRNFFHKTRCNCGGELVLRKNGYQNYTLLSCINPFCFEKMAFSAADFSSAMGIDGLGSATLREMSRAIALNNLSQNGISRVTYQELLVPENILHLGYVNGRKWHEFLDKIEQYDGTLQEFVDAMGLPYIGTVAAKVLTQEVFTDPNLSATQLKEIANSRGMHDLKNILNLWWHLPSIRHVVLNLCKKINLEKVKEFKICITQKISLETDHGIVKYSKEEFVRAINQVLASKGENTIRVVLSKSLTSDCRVLISDGEGGTTKYNKARELGIPVKTSRQFLENPGGA